MSNNNNVKINNINKKLDEDGVENNEMENNTNLKKDHVISKDTIKRLAIDIKRIIKEPLNEHGIYYRHDDENILKGYALIIGQQGTPYAFGNYLFEFDFPYNYPHKPPVVTFLLSDGKTRFNPNYYINGKVCLSILNTWRGDQWTGCQTISSILLALATVFNENPLLNEPGIYESHKDCLNYKRIITYKNLEISILNLLNDKTNIELKSKYIKPFINIINENIINNYNNIIDLIKEEKTKYQTKNNISKNEYVSTSIYTMNVKIDYNYLIDNIYTLKNNILDIRDNIKIELNN